MITSHRLSDVREDLLFEYSEKSRGAIFNTSSVKGLCRYFLEKFQMGFINSIGVEVACRYPVIRLEGVPPQIWKRLLYPEVSRALPYARMEYKNGGGKLTIDIYILTRAQYLLMYQISATHTASSNTTVYHNTCGQTIGGTTITGTYFVCDTNTI